MSFSHGAERLNYRGGEADAGPAAGEAGLDVRAWLQVIRRHKGMIVSVFLIVVVATFFVVNDITPQYTASSKVMIQSDSGNVVNFEAVMSGIGSDSAAVASQIEILTSRALMGRLAEELNLIDDPEFNPHRRPPSSGLFGLNLRDLLPAGLLQALGMRAPGSDVPLDAEAQLELEQTAVIDALLRRIVVEPIPPSFVISLEATSADPAKAALIANSLAKLYILDQLEAKFEATEQANQWLSVRLDELRQQVVATEGAVAAYRVENNLGNSDSQSLIEQQLNQANAQLTIARSELAAAQANYSQVENLLASEGTDSAAQVLANPLIQQLRQQEAEAKRTLAELSTRYGDKHPDIINAQAEIADLQITIQSEVSKIVQNLANEVAVARARASSIEGTVADLNQRFNSERGAEVRLRELEREADATRQLYDTMLSRFKEVGEQEDIQQADARLISEAAVPREPSWPKKDLILAAAAFAGLLIGTGMAFLVEMMRAGFRSLEHIQEVLGLPGLVEIPLLKRSDRRRPHELVIKRPTSAYAESVRSVQTVLALSNVDNPPKTICLVSSVPEEGKSALTASVGRSAAASGRRIILVDCDLRRPQQHRLVGSKRSPGLSELLSGQMSLEDVCRVDDTGLVIIPAGAEVPNPANLLQSQRMKEIIERLRAEYDIVLLDTPAIMALSDGLIVTTLADATLMLVQWERTPRTVALATVRALRSAGARIVGVAMSQVDQRKQASYGYSPYGYYYGRYKSYYADK